MERTVHFLLFNKLLGAMACVSAIFFITGCMPKIENEDPVDSVVITGNDILPAPGLNARIHLYGTCPTKTKNLKMTIDNTAFTLTPSGTIVDGSGTPVGTCTNGNMVITYPVPNPGLSRPIYFQVKAQMNDGRISLYWAQININYAQPSGGPPGFAVTSGGGSITGGADKVIGTTGEVTSPIILNHPSMRVQSGFNGIIFDGSI